MAYILLKARVSGTIGIEQIVFSMPVLMNIDLTIPLVARTSTSILYKLLLRKITMVFMKSLRNYNKNSGASC